MVNLDCLWHWVSLEAASITEKSLFDDSRIGFYLFHLGQPQQVNVNPLLGFNPSGDPGDPRDYVWLYQGQIWTRANLNHWLGGLYTLALRSMSMGTSSHTFRPRSKVEEKFWRWLWDSPKNPEVKWPQSWWFGDGNRIGWIPQPFLPCQAAIFGNVGLVGFPFLLHHGQEIGCGIVDIGSWEVGTHGLFQRYTLLAWGGSSGQGSRPCALCRFFGGLLCPFCCFWGLPRPFCCSLSTSSPGWQSGSLGSWKVWTLRLVHRCRGGPSWRYAYLPPPLSRHWASPSRGHACKCFLKALTPIILVSGTYNYS